LRGYVIYHIKRHQVAITEKYRSRDFFTVDFVRERSIS
jgi:hypothetical protein